MNSLPASGDTVSLYVAHLSSAGRATSTISRALTAIAQMHLDGRFPSPRLEADVTRVLRAVRRSQCDGSRGKDALDRDTLRRVLATLGKDSKSVRDRALLVVGFGAGLRRSELVALDRRDLLLDDDGIVVSIRRSKTDPFAIGRRIRIPTNLAEGITATDAVSAWLQVGMIESGPVFRRVLRSGRVTRNRLGDRAVARIVKALVAKVGLDPTVFGGHSLRRGCATTAAELGQPTHQIADLLGHRTVAMASRYIREVRLPSLPEASSRVRRNSDSPPQGGADPNE